MKCTAAIRQFAYGSTADVFDDYLQMSEHTVRDALFFFNMYTIELYMPKYLRKPTSEDVVNIQQKHNNVHGFPKMLESIDSGANNDINVLDNSPLFDALLDDLAHVVPYVVNGVEYRNGYYLADEIYPEWASFVKSFTVATDPKHTYFKQRQESARKDVEQPLLEVGGALLKVVASLNLKPVRYSGRVIAPLASISPESIATTRDIDGRCIGEVCVHKRATLITLSTSFSSNSDNASSTNSSSLLASCRFHA
uniref:Protein ALP1-like n=1 Tax=Tanacetum cinerariifolium TaxID=118510 RepID=A0A699L5Q7_TANCI|nr:hypothetical protein [Tanacetum cinerariifolium]